MSGSKEKILNGLYYMNASDLNTLDPEGRGDVYYSETIDFIYVVKREIEVVLVPFVAERDSARYVYGKIQGRELEENIGKVRGIGKIRKERQ